MFEDATALMSATLESLVPEHRGRLQLWVEEECWPLMCQCPNSHGTFHDMWGEVCEVWWQKSLQVATPTRPGHAEPAGSGDEQEETRGGNEESYATLADNPNRRSVYV